MVIHAGYATGSQGLSKLQCWKTSCSVCATGSQCKLKWWKSRSWAVYKLSEVQVQMVLLCVSYPSYATVLCISYTVPEVQVQMVLLCVGYPSYATVLSLGYLRSRSRWSSSVSAILLCYSAVYKLGIPYLRSRSRWSSSVSAIPSLIRSNASLSSFRLFRSLPSLTIIQK